MNFKYPKEEKLKQKKDITLLFEKGKWMKHDQISIIFLQNSETEHQKIGVSVSKRNFKKAVDRNRIKRLLREAYRLNKQKWVEAFGENTIAMIFWNSSNMPQKFNEVESNFLALCESRSSKK